MAKNKKKKNTKLKVILISQIIFLSLVIAVLAFYFLGGYAKEVKALQEDAIALVNGSTQEKIGRAHV